MFGDMMEKLQEMQQKVAESKARLETITVDGKADAVSLRMNGNRKVTAINIDDEVMDDKESLEDLLILAFNRALEQADKVNEAEMASSAQGILPNIPGFGG